MPHDLPRKSPYPKPESAEVRTPVIRPAYVYSNARKAYDEVYRQWLADHPGEIRNGAIYGLKAYDKVIENYDRKYRPSSNSSD